MNRIQKSILMPWEKYQRLMKQMGSQTEHPSSTTTTPLAIEEAPNDTLSVDTVLQAIPKNARQRARALLSHIVDDGRLTWNRKGEISYLGQLVPGSHITDLVKDSQYHYKHFNPIGYELFYNALKDMNMPQGLIGHRERLKIIPSEQSLQETSGQSPSPPGIRVYRDSQKKKRNTHPIKWLNM